MKKASTKPSEIAETKEVTDLLHEDHQKVRDLFFKFSSAEEDEEKESLVEQILTELHIHSTVEEEIVYAAVEKDAEGAQDLLDEANTEHRMVKYLMAELSGMSAADDLYDAKVTVLCELVEHHVREEEKEMFEKLHESGADLKALTTKVLQRKAVLKGLPLPAMEATLSIEKPAKPPLKAKPAPKQRKSA